MHPHLFTLFGQHFPSYFVLIAVGFGSAVWYVARLANQVGIHPNRVIDMGLWALLAGLLGARGLHVLVEGHFWDYVHLCTAPLEVDIPQFIHVACQKDADCIVRQSGGLCHPETQRCHPAQDCFAALKFWHGGLTFLGGVIAATLSSAWYLHRHRIPFLKMADLGVLGVAIGSFFGRIGCFLGGCCFGTQTQSPLGIQFPGRSMPVETDGGCALGWQRLVGPDGPFCAVGRPAYLEQLEAGQLTIGAHLSQPVWPSQLLASALALVIFIVLTLRRRRQRFEGQLFFEFLVLYGIGRIGLETIRGDGARGLWFLESVSTSQIIVAPIILWAAYRWWTGDQRPLERP
ncbi:MAG: prolipoprotein diacylglyceryl transferase family protein [Myxococcota bacterium]|nr:prolipoprotein diacylglyceryl transferase family protein [Myxococcota bacterium]